MKYLIDTNICIYLIKKKSPQLLNRLIETPVQDVAVSVITVAELEFGAQKSLYIEKNLTALQQFLSPFQILPFTEQDCKVYGRIRANLETSGLPIGAMDLMIAAQAQSHDLILVTNDTREFSRIRNLKCEDWTQGI
jgi:tRNA(fMet)-specific endonuclease VapC